MDTTLIKEVSNWIHRNARPIDMARWSYLFEDGSKEAVIKELEHYQNEDGGFAYGLEADCWNDESQPIQTWKATEIIHEIGGIEKSHSLISDILTYLENCPHFSNYRWHGTIPSNNNCSHGEWWDYSEDMVRIWNWNPTVCLAGFILFYSDKDSNIYNLGKASALEGYSWFRSQEHMESMHQTFCFLRLYEYLVEAGISNLIDLEEFKELLNKHINDLIEKDSSIWQTEYVCKPSFFINSKESMFYTDNIDITKYEVDFIMNSRTSEGVWNPSWAWSSYGEQWHIAKNWWKADIAIKNVKFLKNFS